MESQEHQVKRLVTKGIEILEYNFGSVIGKHEEAPIEFVSNVIIGVPFT